MPNRKPATAVASAGIVLAISYVLAVLVRAIGAESVVDGALAGAVVWLGFVLTLGLSSAIFEKRTLRYVAITAGQSLVSLTLMGALFGAWR